MKGTTKRVIALALTLVMLCGMLPLSVSAEGDEGNNSAQQIYAPDGATVYYEYDEDAGAFKAEPVIDSVTENTEKADVPHVTTSKTIAGVEDMENVFDITLQVETTQKIEQTSSTPDAAVVLVLDLSGSMDYCVNCSTDRYEGYNHNYYYGHNFKSRLEAAKESAISFLQSYAGLTKNGDGSFTYADPNAARYVSIVTYSDGKDEKTQSAEVLVDWIDIHDADQSAVEGSISTIQSTLAPVENLSAQSTNTDIGLYFAENQWQKFIGTGANQLNRSDVTSRFTVLLTDGEPNARRNSAPGNEYGTLDNLDNYPSGNTYKGDSYAYPALRANRIRSYYKSQLYSVALATGTTATTWLNAISDKSVGANSSKELLEAFEWMNLLISLSIDAWKVEDPMGDYIKYVSYEGAHTAGAVTPPATVNDSLVWDLKSDLNNAVFSYMEGGDKKTATYADYIANPNREYTITYTLKYRIELDNIVAPVSANAYLTNKRTTLDYYLTKYDNTTKQTDFIDNDGIKITDPEKALLTLDFKVPAVKSLYGSLSFTKRGPEEEIIEGAQFGLYLADAQGNLILVDESPILVTTATSTGSGAVDFSAIPSGHKYVLKEISVGEKYAVSEETAVVTVAWGAATSTGDLIETGKDGNPTVYNGWNPKNTDFTVTKIWQDETNNYEGKTINFTLTDSNGIEHDYSMTIANKTDGDSKKWEKTISLPTINVSDGSEITYTLTEERVSGYAEPSINNSTLTITNTLVSDVDLTVNKIWQDGSNAFGTRPEKVTFTLTGMSSNGESEKYTATLDMTPAATDNTQSITFLNVPKYDNNGALYTFTIAESSIGTKYTSTLTENKLNSDGTATFTNTLNQEYVTIGGNKTWVDDNNANDTRPEDITVILKQNGTEVNRATVTPSEGKWEYSFTKDSAAKDLPKYNMTDLNDIKLYAYTITEEAVSGYTTTYPEGTYNVTNTVTGTVEVAVEKVWVDESGTTHDAVQVQLLANGVAVVGKLANVTDNYTFENLPKYDTNGALITYTVREDNVPSGYTVSYDNMKDHDDSDDFSYVITNKLNDPANVTISGSKNWQHPTRTNAPTITINLYYTVGEDKTPVPAGTKVLTAGTTDYEFTGLEKYSYVNVAEENEPEDIQAVERTYYVVEDGLTGYDTTYSGHNITNTITGKTSVAVTKVWQDLNSTNRPSITLTLSRSANGTTDGDFSASYVMPSTETTYTFTNLDKYDAQGQLYTYTVTEGTVSGYSAKYSDNQATDGTFSYSITNTLNQSETTITGTKTWVDGNNGNNTRPESITVILKRNGTEVNRTTVTPNSETGAWSYTFTQDSDGKNLVQYNDDRSATYTYSVEEVAVSGYTTTYPTGYDIRNTLSDINNSGVSVTVRKTWVHPEGTIAPSVKFTLKQNGIAIRETTLEPGTTEYTFTNLDKYTGGGSQYVYTVEEEAVSGYAMTNQSGTSFTNTIDETNDMTIAGEKHWAGVDENALPDSITVALYANRDYTAPVRVQKVTPAEDGTWTYVFEELPVYTADRQYYATYEVYELNLQAGRIPANGTVKYGGRVFTVTYGYTATIENETVECPYDIVNTFTPQQSEDTYSYRIDTYYTVVTDGVAGTPVLVTGTTENGRRAQSLNALAASFHTDDYKTYNEQDYTYTSGSLSIGATLTGETFAGGTYRVEVDEVNQEYVIRLYYQRTVTTPTNPDKPDNPGGGTNYTITINYLELDTNKVLATKYTSTHSSGYKYNVAGEANKAITDYNFDHIDDESLLEGTLRKNITINVYYTQVVELPDNPDTPRDNWEEPKDPTDPEPTNPVDPIDTTEPTDPTEEVELPDEEKPRDNWTEETPNLPKTGVSGLSITNPVMFAVLLSMIAFTAGALLLTLRKKEEEEQ